MPPSAIIRSVCNAIWIASSPSVVERFTDQYDMRNIRFTMEGGRDRKRGEIVRSSIDEIREMTTMVCGVSYLVWGTWERL